MSIFASYFSNAVHPPAAPTESITIHKLSGRAVEIAQAAHKDGVFRGFNGRGWANEFLRRLLDGTATEADAKKVSDDPLAGYDRLAVVKHGISAWSFTEPGEKAGETKPKAVTPAAIEDIDDETLEFLAIEIMKLTKPALFMTADEREAARKNG